MSTFGDEPAPLVTDAFKGEKEQTSGQKTKQRKHNKKAPQQEEDLPEQVLEVLNETELEKVKKKKKKHRQESENQEPTVEVSELSEPETKKKKNHKDSRSTVMVLPREHLTETSLDGNPVTVEHDTEASVLEASTAVGGRQKAKKKRAKQHLPPPEPAATPVLGQMEAQKNKRRTEQLHDSPKLGEIDLEGQKKKKKKKKKRRIELLPDSPVLGKVEIEGQKKTEPLPDSPVLMIAETENEGQKMSKKRTEQLSDSPMLGENGIEGKKKKKKRRTEQLPDSPVLGAVEVEGQKETDQVPSCPMLQETDIEGQKKKKKKRRIELLPNPPVLGAVEGQKETDQVPGCPMLQETDMEEQKKKRRKKKRTEQLLDSSAPAATPVLREVMERQKKRTEQLPDCPASVFGETEKERQKTKMQNREDVVMEVVTEFKKEKHDRVIGVADERTSERQTDGEESQLSTRETGTQHDKHIKKEDYKEELEDFVPNIKSESSEEIHKLIKYDLDRFKTFKSQGETDLEGQKKKRRRIELLPNPPVLGAVEGQKETDQLPGCPMLQETDMEGQKMSKKRTGQLPDSPVLGEIDMVGQKRKKKKRTEQLLDSSAPAATPVLREVMERQKKRTDQLPDCPASVFGETEKARQKTKMQNREDVVMEVVTEFKKEKHDRVIWVADERTSERQTDGEESQLSTRETGTQHEAKHIKKEDYKEELEDFVPNIKSESSEEIHKLIKYDLDRFKAFKSQGETDLEGQKKKRRRIELLPDPPVLGAVEGQKETDQVPGCPMLQETDMEEQKKKRRKKKRTEQLLDSSAPAATPVLREVMERQKKRTDQLPDCPASVFGETEKERQKTKMQNRENVVMEVVTEFKKKKKKKHDIVTGFADERTSERQTDGEESQLSTRETGTQHEEAFKSQGIPLRIGRFTVEEIKRLNKNVSDFLVLTAIESATHLFHPQRFKDQYIRIKQLRSQHTFHQKIAEGIHRPWRSVYNRGRMMFDNNNYKGRLTRKELHQLNKLHAQHGNKWKRISEVMKRSRFTLAQSFSRIGSNKGAWSVEETSRLMDAMREHLRGLTEPAGENQMNGEVIRKEKLCKNIPWTDISHKVQTRSWQQCNSKWMSLLKEKMAPGHQAVFSRGIKSIQAKINLIERIYAMQVEDAADIDWNKVVESMGNVTPYYIQQQFNRLKRFKVPLWKQMTYCDIIDFMYKDVVPELKASLTKASERQEIPEQTADPKEYFLLSDICGVEGGQSQRGLHGDRKRTRPDN